MNDNQETSFVHLLKGAPVSASIREKTQDKREKLRELGITPVIAVLRVGVEEDDLSYERSLVKRCESVEAEVRKFVLPLDASTEDVLEKVREINEDPNIHGALIFSPMPSRIDEEKVRYHLKPEKDLDGFTPLSQYGILMGKKVGFPPCTPEACLRILDYYGIDMAGKRTAVVGRSQIVGKPVALILLGRNATVTVCHRKTVDTKAICRNAEVVVAAAGSKRLLTKDYFSPGQIVLDVGINMDDDGSICGDVDFAEVEPMASCITPVPGGVGSVTTSLLLEHLMDAALNTVER